MMINKFLDKALLVLTIILLIFIPLYPKLPLFDIIPGYLVRARIEDFLIAITLAIYGISFFRKKISIQTPLNKWICYYALGGFLSLITASLIIKTIPIDILHLSKSLLHWIRYLEYFSLFFVIFSVAKSAKIIYWLLGTMIITIFAISVYGFGQKFFYWPVYSTMSREFSKGVRLYLTPHARVQSTFGGHYDLSAYLVIALPIVMALSFVLTNKWLRLTLQLVQFSGLWLLIAAASRTSFIAFIFASALTIFLFGWKKIGWLAKLKFIINKSIYLTFSIVLLMILFGSDMYERFVQVLQSYPTLNNAYHTANKQRKDTIEWVLISTGLKPKPPDNGMSVDEARQRNLISDPENVLVPSDQRPSTEKPSDVYVDVPDKVRIATISETGETSYTIVERPRTWSEAAMKYGLSMGIRLDTLWPRAIHGFLRGPIFGSGYATLNKDTDEQFTEAESTDNNFLRTLGETGLFGFITFYGTIVCAIYLAWQVRNNPHLILQALAIGYLSGAIGLLINALYIDVFAASKVAYTFWCFTGLMVAFTKIEKDRATNINPTLNVILSHRANKKQQTTRRSKRAIK